MKIKIPVPSAVYVTGVNQPVMVKTINIGAWDMDATLQVTVAHGITMSQLIACQAWIWRDDLSSYNLLGGATAAGTMMGRINLDATDVVLTRTTGGGFDSVNYDDAVMNRGHIVLWYY